MSDTILIVDDDDDIRTYLDITLSLAGYEVLAAVDGAEGIEQALNEQPSLILMDVMMPRLDGIAAIERLRADGRTSHIPIILVTARSQNQDKIDGLAVGADDYVTKPFDPDELVARVQATLRRAGQMRSVSPLTGLPGNARIEQEIGRRIDLGEPFALLYADLNQFKAYNDHYGFMRGDGVISLLARVVREAASHHGDVDTFVGHIGGDDFVVVTDVSRFEEIATDVCHTFDREVPAYYDDDEREQGYIEVTDRQGDARRFPLATVSIGVVTTKQREFTHPGQVVEIATEMKNYAKKRSEGSSTWAVDRRS